MENKNNIPNQLPNEPGTNPFRVPEGYFDNFAYNMQIKIADLSHEKVRFNFFFRPAMVMAYASLALIITAGTWLYISNQQDLSNALSADEIAYYTEMNSFDFDEYLMMNEFSEILSEQESDQEIYSDHVTEEDVIEFLNEN